MTNRKNLELIARAYAAHLPESYRDILVEKAPAFQFRGWDTFGPANYRIGAGWRVRWTQEDGYRSPGVHIYIGKTFDGDTHYEAHWHEDGSGAEFVPTERGWRVRGYGQPRDGGWFLPAA